MFTHQIGTGSVWLWGEGRAEGRANPRAAFGRQMSRAHQGPGRRGPTPGVLPRSPRRVGKGGFHHQDARGSMPPVKSQRDRPREVPLTGGPRGVSPQRPRRRAARAGEAGAVAAFHGARVSVWGDGRVPRMVGWRPHSHANVRATARRDLGALCWAEQASGRKMNIT